MKTYVSWAAKQGFAVIDVNLPKHITTNQPDSQEHEESESTEWRTREATQLLAYLWDNYIELNESTHVFLIGTNIGHGAIVSFIKQNEERAQETTTKAISFIEDVPLLSCKSTTNDLLASWYYASSQVYVAGEHNFWYSDYARKIKKRFGRIYRSPEDSMSDMLVAHKDAVTAMLLEDTREWREQRLADVERMPGLNTTEPMGRTGLPPVSNFAMTPQMKSNALDSALAPISSPANNFALQGRRDGTPQQLSPSRVPPIANFAPSPKRGLSRSPAR